MRPSPLVYTQIALAHRFSSKRDTARVFDEKEPKEEQREARRKRSRKGRLIGGLGGPG